MSRTVVVTGASGFIGQAVLTELVNRGIAAVGVSRRHFNAPAAVETVIVADYRDTPIHENATLIHLAEGADVSDAERQGHAHLCAVRQQVEALLAFGWQRFVYASSGRVYGSQDVRPHHPSDPTSADCIYVRAKIAAEELVVQRSGGVVARIANVYGPPLKANTVIGDILAQIPGSGPLFVRDARPARDFLWLADAARGLADISAGETTGVFNLGTGSAVSAGEIARTTLALAGEKARNVRSIKAADDGKTDVIALDATTTEAAFGWRPRMTLQGGLQDLMQGKE